MDRCRLIEQFVVYNQFCHTSGYFLNIFLGGSLADLIDQNKKNNDSMVEGDLKQLLLQVAEV